VAASGALWWIARSRYVSASQLLNIGLLYEITLCFVIATITMW